MSGASGSQRMGIFISHSSSDSGFASALAGALRGAGADVWLDDSHLGAGELMDDIIKQLKARAVFVVVLSKAAVMSEWVQRECRWAYSYYTRDRSRMLLPVVCAKMDPGDLDDLIFLDEFRRIEAPGYQPYPQSEAISRALQLLQLTPAGQPVQHAAPPQPAESADDLITRGKALNVQQRFVEALPLLERATQLTPDNFAAWDSYSYALVKSNRFEEALAASARALALNSNYPVVWKNYGNALFGVGLHEKALAAYDRALSIDPKYAVAWNNKGNVLRTLKRYEEALACYIQALEIDDRIARRWRNKASALRALGRKAEAREAEERAKALGG